MMRNSSPWRREAPSPSVETTALHLADAISFLMRVASDAGLGNIAVNLAGVRASLLASERCEAAKTRLAEDESSRGDSIAEVDSE
jgi:hypothetical protein